MSSAYIIANVTVTDPQQYEEYKKWSPDMPCLGKIIGGGLPVGAYGGKAEVMEGDWQPERLVVLKFPSVEAARKFDASPEYGKARAARKGAAVMRMVLVEGV